MSVMGSSDLALGVAATMFKENPALDSSTRCKNTFCSGLLQLEKKDLRLELGSTPGTARASGNLQPRSRTGSKDGKL